MELVAKGAIVEATKPFKTVKVLMDWGTERDYDIGALVESKDGKKDLLYFGELVLPGIKHTGDKGVAGSSSREGFKTECIDVMDLTSISKIFILCWDYDAMIDNTSAQFSKDDLQVRFSLDNGEEHALQVEAGDTGNISVMALIDSSSELVKFQKLSHPATLKGFPSESAILEKLCAAAEAAVA